MSACICSELTLFPLSQSCLRFLSEVSAETSLMRLFERSSVSSVLSCDSGDSREMALLERSRCFTFEKPETFEMSLKPRPFASTVSASQAKLLLPRTISLRVAY